MTDLSSEIARESAVTFHSARRAPFTHDGEGGAYHVVDNVRDPRPVLSVIRMICVSVVSVIRAIRVPWVSVIRAIRVPCQLRDPRPENPRCTLQWWPAVVTNA
jgi:hypothetical protein